ncbi:LysR family transcriptional regulator [Aeromicrobium sp. CF4.19]|uniref:LysR family transcriptional regulator n=1 Tax=Aeromicrobium sp. CF4.19 TaxID=3373082 RepID=UPI003EE6D79C
MEVRQARHFLAIVDHGTTGRAAATLHVTQPALSQSIVALERELRAQLFVRSTRGMTLTSAGETLVQPARSLIESSVRAIAAIEGSMDVPRGELTLAVTPALASTPVSPWVARFRARYPHVMVRLLAYYGDESVETFFDRHGVELLVTFDGAPGADRVRCVEGGAQEMVVALPPGMPVGEGPTVRLDQIAHLPFAVAPPNTSMRRLLLAAFEQIGAPLHVSVESPFMDALPSLVAAGAGAAILPAETAGTLRAAGSVVKHPDPPINRHYYLYYSEHHLSYAAQAFVRTVLSGL